MSRLSVNDPEVLREVVEAIIADADLLALLAAAIDDIINAE